MARGKKRRPYRDEPDSKEQRRRIDNRERERDERGDDELIVYRILCPDGVIGSVIGKSGKVINSIRQESRAKVKVVDPFPGAKERVITIYCYVREKDEVDIDGEFNDNRPLCDAQDALLRVHAAIANARHSQGESDGNKKDKDREECQLLVPSSQSASIIGKSGATIKRLRNKTRTNIKVTAKDASDPFHSCALEFDNFVLISGEPEAVKKALFAVSSIMYSFSPKENIPLDMSVPEAPPSIIIPSDVPIYPASGLYPGLEPIHNGRQVPPILGPSHDIPGYARAGSTWPVYPSALPVVSGYGAASQYKELIIKVLCPSNKIGRVIGKGGSSIKSIRQETSARIEVDDHPKANRSECIISVITTESSEDLKSMAVEAVLLLQGKINGEDGDTVTMQLLIPSKVIGCIIGKSGSIVNEIRKRTNADIRISKGDKPKYADGSDELVEVIGHVSNVRDALIQIVLRLRDDVLKDREDVRNSSTGTEALYAGGASLPMSSVFRSGAALSYDERIDTRSGLGLPSSSGYGYGPVPIGGDGYGSTSTHSAPFFAGLPPPAALEMVIPAHAVGKVMGKGGTNIDNICKISGADVEIPDTRSSRGDRVAIIFGTTEQKRAAENLIQAFIMAT